MSVESMTDSTCTVYSFSEAVTGGLRSKTNSYVAGATEDCALAHGQFPVSDAGDGNRKRGSTLVYLRADAVVSRNDVLDVTGGPDVVRLKVLSVARPRGNHTEAVCEPFAGAL